MSELQNIRELILAGRLDEALSVASQLLDVQGENAEVLYLRGRVYWRLGQRREAITDYTASALLQPGGPASLALAQATEIMDFYNHDLYNP